MFAFGCSPKHRAPQLRCIGFVPDHHLLNSSEVKTEFFYLRFQGVLINSCRVWTSGQTRCNSVLSQIRQVQLQVIDLLFPLVYLVCGENTATFGFRPGRF